MINSKLTSCHRVRWCGWALTCALVLGVCPAAAQDTPAPPAVVAVPAGDSRPIVTAIRVAEAPALDGDVLGDTAWQRAAPVSTFWQEQPDQGEPASERTEVRIVFTGDTLYIGVVCYDNDPQSITVSDSRRDADLQETDSFRIIFDTYRDRQNGFVFGTNPAGIEYDGQVTNEGQGGGGLAFGSQMSGSGGGFNLNWDGAWRVRTRTSDIGWTAEFAIPFRTLRFPSNTNTDLGRELPAQYPAQERALVLGGHPPAVRLEPRVAGGHAGGPRDAGAANVTRDAVCPRQRGREW